MNALDVALARGKETPFLNVMRTKWSEFGNVASPALNHVWTQIEATLNRQAGTDARDVWPVIPCELGAGKSTAAKAWCATDATRPGVLIVVPTKDQADEYARDINTWSGVPGLAFAHHSGLPLAARQNLDALASYPVLIVCHKSYELGLDDFAVDVSRLKFEKMHRYGRDGQRALVVIDKSLDQVHEERIRRDALKELLSKLPRAVEKVHLDAMRVIESVNSALRAAPDERNRTFSTTELLALTSFTADQADALLLALWEQGLRGAKIEPELRARLGQTLSALRRHLSAYRRTAGDGKLTALTGHRLLLLPPSTHGVVFDATARLNNVYLGRPSEFEVQRTTQVRDYSTVTVYDARTNETGKRAATENGERLAADTIAALREHYGDRAGERRVLVVVAKDGEEHFRTVGTGAGFAAFDMAHWNKIDGRNDWRDFDTLCVATLPYANDSLDLNTYMAVNEKELDDAALNAPPDEVKLIRENRIAAQLAQAMGRIRLRTMTRMTARASPATFFSACRTASGWSTRTASSTRSSAPCPAS